MKLKNAPARKLIRQFTANLHNGTPIPENWQSLVDAARTVRTKIRRVANGY